MIYYQKPENALRRARELEAVNKPQLALEALDDLITSRRHKTWTKTHEDIMIKYIDLCLQLGKGREAKDGLHKYKNIASSTAVSSLEKVINHFLKKAEDRVVEAVGEASRVFDDIDDLDNPDTPESVLLQAVTEEQDRQRTDRVILTPWLKFLWEAYRTVLDILRNNAKLEELYQGTAIRAFQFCLDYERKSEFRRLCDLLRYHLDQVIKYQNQTNAIDLTSLDSLHRHLEVRFRALDVAIELNLWQEAYKTIEAISNLRDVFKQPLDPRRLALFYDKLAMVLLQSKDYAYHATAWHKLFQVHKDQRRTFSAEEATTLASRVLLATLSIPAEAAAGSASGLGVVSQDYLLERQLRLSALVRVNNVPTRDQLVAQMLALNIMQHVDPQLRDLYNWLEIQFHPLKLSSKVAPLLEFLAQNEAYKAYVEPLQEIIMFRLLQQLSQVYETIRLARLAELVSFADETQVERFVVKVVKQRLLKIQVCHRTRSVMFGTNVFSAATSAEGPRLQLLQSEMMRSQLTTLSKRLHQAVDMIDPQRRVKQLQKRRATILENIESRVTREHQHILSRKALIERRKEYIEALTKLKFQEEEEKTQKQLEEQRAQEAERLQKEAEERKAKMKQLEVEELEKEQAVERVKALSKSLGTKLLEKLNVTDITTVDPDELVRLQIEHLEKDSKDRQARQRANEKKLDYLERAKRVLEIPKIEAYMEEQQKGDQEWFKEQRQIRVEQSKQEHAKNLALKTRLTPMAKFKQDYCASILQQRRQAFQHDSSRYQEERKAREEEEAERRRAEQEERERREREEEELRQREEAEREEQERLAEERRKQREEERRKADEIAERTRQKEREIEERLARERAAERDAGPSSRSAYRPPAAGGGGGGGGGWRDRVAARTQGGDEGPPQRAGAYRPPGAADDSGSGGGGSTWRDREAARAQGGGGREIQREAPRPGGWREREAMRDGDRAPDRAPDRSGGDAWGRPREISRDRPAREIQRDGPRDAPREIQRDAPREIQRDGPRDAPQRDAPREIQRDSRGDDRRPGPREDRARAPRDEPDDWRSGSGDDRQPRSGGNAWRDRRSGDRGDRRDDRRGDRGDRTGDRRGDRAGERGGPARTVDRKQQQGQRPPAGDDDWTQVGNAKR